MKIIEWEEIHFVTFAETKLPVNIMESPVVTDVEVFSNVVYEGKATAYCTSDRRISMVYK